MEKIWFFGDSWCNNGDPGTWPFLLAEQNTNVALKNSDHGYIIETGKVMLEGTAKSLLNDDKVKELYLGISKEGRKNFRDVLKEEGRKKKKKVN